MEAKPNQGFSALIIFMLAIAIIFFVRLMFDEKDSNHKEFTKNESTENKTLMNTSNVEIGNINDGTFQEFENKILILKSKLNDKEFNGKIIQTNIEESTHKFDFKNKLVTLETVVDGEILNFKYPMRGFYKQKGIMSVTNVIIVKTLGVKEIWFNLELPNLGYDYDDGSRIACYEIARIK